MGLSREDALREITKLNEAIRIQQQSQQKQLQQYHHSSSAMSGSGTSGGGGGSWESSCRRSSTYEPYNHHHHHHFPSSSSHSHSRSRSYSPSNFRRVGQNKLVGKDAPKLKQPKKAKQSSEEKNLAKQARKATDLAKRSEVAAARYTAPSLSSNNHHNDIASAAVATEGFFPSLSLEQNSSHPIIHTSSSKLTPLPPPPPSASFNPNKIPLNTTSNPLSDPIIDTINNGFYSANQQPARLNPNRVPVPLVQQQGAGGSSSSSSIQQQQQQQQHNSQLQFYNPEGQQPSRFNPNRFPIPLVGEKRQGQHQLDRPLPYPFPPPLPPPPPRPSATLRIGEVVGGEANAIGESNVGHKLMRAMGWTPGKALGRSGEGGITEPVTVTVRASRTGLGIAGIPSKNTFSKYYGKYRNHNGFSAGTVIPASVSFVTSSSSASSSVASSLSSTNTYLAHQEKKT